MQYTRRKLYTLCIYTINYIYYILYAWTNIVYMYVLRTHANTHHKLNMLHIMCIYRYSLCACMYACMHACMYACIYVCMHNSAKGPLLSTPCAREHTGAVICNTYYMDIFYYIYMDNILHMCGQRHPHVTMHARIRACMHACTRRERRARLIESTRVDSA